MKRKRGKAVVRRFWGGLHPATKIIPDKTKRPFRRRKHKKKPAADDF